MEAPSKSIFPSIYLAWGYCAAAAAVVMDFSHSASNMVKFDIGTAQASRLAALLSWLIWLQLVGVLRAELPFYCRQAGQLARA